jgi:hypothetical protein
MAQGFVMRILFFLCVGVFLVLPVLAQVDATATPDASLLTPTETVTLTPTWIATFTPEFTATPLPSNTPEVTEIIVLTLKVTAEVTESISPIVEITAEVTESVEMTAEVSPDIDVILPVFSPSPEITVAVTQPEATVEVTAEITEVVEVTPEVTAEITEVIEVTPEVTEEIIVPTVSSLMTATPGGMALRFVQGIVTYQNRASSAGIEVMIWSDDDVLLSVATTNESGIYSVPVPVDQPYWISVDGELHQAARLRVEIDQSVPPLTLAGGDLDDDGCIGAADLDMLIQKYDLAQTPASDINADGSTNLSDLAILTGNYQNCDVEPAPVVEITPEVAFEVTAEATADVTAQITVETTVEVTPEVTAEATVEPTQP